MKTIKVFLASSIELIEERKEFGFLFCHLNRIYRPRGIYLELVPWEYLDSSMGPLHKQQEYNKELDTCELCLVLFWTKFGDYTCEVADIYSIHGKENCADKYISHIQRNFLQI